MKNTNLKYYGQCGNVSEHLQSASQDVTTFCEDQIRHSAQCRSGSGVRRILTIPGIPHHSRTRYLDQQVLPSTVSSSTATRDPCQSEPEAVFETARPIPALNHVPWLKYLSNNGLTPYTDKPLKASVLMLNTNALKNLRDRISLAGQLND